MGGPEEERMDLRGDRGKSGGRASVCDQNKFSMN